MPTNWNRKSPRLLPAIVCYADILGFRAMTECAYKLGDEAKFLRRIKRSLATAYKQVRDYAKPWEAGPPTFEMKVFTDNIVVANPLSDPDGLGEGELGTFLILFSYVQAQLAAEGFFLRGAITAGDHYQDRDIVYGQTLLEAVDLDKQGGPPRIVIGSSVEPLISKHLSWYGRGSAPHHEQLLEDPWDGRLFVNYLDVAFEGFPHDSPIDYKFLDAHRKKVTEGLHKYESDMSVRSKFTWLATYHNYVCNTFAGEYQEDEELDPWLMEVVAEAQHTLKYLVSFEPGAQDQSPLPLDANRLEQRLTTG